jgi:hypothetical protein
MRKLQMAIGPSDYHILCEVKNKQSISEVLTRHDLGCDRGELDLILSAYHGDALVEDELFCGSPVAYHERILADMYDKTLSTMHITSNVLIEIDEMTGTIAACESYFQAIIRFQRGAEIFDRIECGRRIDHFECRTIKERCRMGSWKIARRIILSEWDRTEPVAEQNHGCRDRRNLGARHIIEKAALSFFDRRPRSMPSGQISPLSGRQFENLLSRCT